MADMASDPSLPSSPSDTDRVNQLMGQARAKLEARLAGLQDTPLPLAPPLSTAEEEAFNARLERCIAKTDALLVEARAYLRRPAKLPKQRLKPTEHAAKRMSTGLQLCEATTRKAITDADYAADSAKGLLMAHAARKTSVSSSPKGTSALSAEAPCLLSGVESERRDAGSLTPACGMPEGKLEVKSPKAQQWRSVVEITADLSW